jgi:hypothetical protein
VEIRPKSCQVDENMARAQKRHAAACGKFYFRKDVYAIGRSGASSIASSGPSSPGTEMPLKKDKKMRNCFPPLPLPENGVLDLSKPVDEEYEEMTMNEIINGKVRSKSFFFSLAFNNSTGRIIPGPFGPCICILGNIRDRGEGLGQNRTIFGSHQTSCERYGVIRFGGIVVSYVLPGSSRIAPNPCDLDQELCTITSRLQKQLGCEPKN